jgi:hypothetical protein
MAAVGPRREDVSRRRAGHRRRRPPGLDARGASWQSTLPGTARQSDCSCVFGLVRGAEWLRPIMESAREGTTTVPASADRAQGKPNEA